jgi:hypothetical protein
MFRSFENKDLTFVSNCFRNKKKDEMGHYGQALMFVSKVAIFFKSLESLVQNV